MELIDLSRVIYDGMPKIPILPDVHVRKFFDLDKGHPLNVTELSLPCHAGTHVDAPIHIVPNGKSIEELPLDASSATARRSPCRRAAARKSPQPTWKTPACPLIGVIF